MGLGLKKLLITLIASTSCAAQIPSQTQQLIVVVTKDWNDLHGTAQRYQRSGRSFHKVGSSFAIVVGKNGMGWDPAMPLDDASSIPTKHEGDGKSPAGIFEVGTAFGYGPTAFTRMAYMPLTSTVECVDDVASSRYNQLVDSPGPDKDWRSSEKMLRNDGLYQYGIFVDYNTPPRRGWGSCIFMHIWRGPDIGTVGCTAMEQSSILLLFDWLDPAKRPELVQMPMRVYNGHRHKWGLPRL